MDNNSTQQVELRRHRSTLSIVGTGVIVLGLYLLAEALFGEFIVSGSNETGALDSKITTVFLLVASLAMRLYIGLSARAEGRGARRSPLYLLSAGIVILADLGLGALVFYYIFAMGNGTLPLVATLVAELASAFTLIQLIYASVMVRRLQDGRD